jgi:hypothetical protein
MTLGQLFLGMGAFCIIAAAALYVGHIVDLGLKKRARERRALEAYVRRTQMNGSADLDTYNQTVDRR